MNTFFFFFSCRFVCNNDLRKKYSPDACVSQNNDEFNCKLLIAFYLYWSF